MKLKEKFIKCKNKYDQYYILPVVDDAEQLVKIADEFAIGFAEWCIESEGKEYNKYKYRNRKELLEIYKKEKQL